jgi:uncharacterized protein YdeI (YjbR/CyaY-like superfamily)
MSQPELLQFFASPEEFRRWLDEHHGDATELWVGFYKRDSGRPSITWPESVDEALCYGWIDGIRKSVSVEAYTIRFTPRKRGSIWSNVNIEKARELVRTGRMQPAGMRALEARDEKKSGIYSFERNREAKLTASELKRFKANRGAWTFFETQPPSYRRVSLHWVVSAKRPETRERRLNTLIADSAAGRRIAPLRRPTGK